MINEICEHALRRPKHGVLFQLTAVLLVTSQSTSGQTNTAATEQRCVVIQAVVDQPLTVQFHNDPLIKIAANSSALIVWANATTEGWRFQSDAEPFTIPSAPGATPGGSDFHAVRGHGNDVRGASNGVMTIQLDQLLGQVVVRGSSFLTPEPNGLNLNGRITIRRAPGNGVPQLPLATAVLSRGQRELAHVTFQAGQQKIAFKDIPELVKTLPDGLPAGEYTLRMEGGTESSTFTVLDREDRDYVMAETDRFERLLGDRTGSLCMQIAVETLLQQQDEEGQVLSFSADALDLLESVPAETLTAHLQQIHQRLLRQLTGEETNAGVGSNQTAGNDTGVAQIDDARHLIAAGNWDAAFKQLQPDSLPDDRRIQALGSLYRAVIYSESGSGSDNEAGFSFHAAIRDLADSPSDLYRAHNNYANFLLSRTQDRLFNHAFQMATGAQHPLMTAMSDWLYARDHYNTALQLAGTDTSRRAAVQINLARLYALLGDVVRTLESPGDGIGHEALSDAAAARTVELLEGLTNAKPETIDPLLRASAAEIQAHLAFRGHQEEVCVRNAETAMKSYLDAGSLAGVEGLHRLLGLHHLRAASPDARRQALQHFLVSHDLSELLRERIPPDHQLGLSQAGFFARRAYVNEKIIELLIENNDAADALRYAELAKARSLQDLLSVEGGATGDSGDTTVEDEQPLSEMLSHWPKDVVALEYFVGTQKTWLFVITDGNVTAHDVLGDRTSPDLILEVGQYLNDTDHFLPQMSTRLRTGKGFDHAWQDRLHDFYKLLVPNGVLEQLQSAKTVVVVPHHILHYFPFAALVTQRDTEERGNYEMVRPRFLIDETFNLVYVPSLTVWQRMQSRPDRPVSRAAAIGISDYLPLGESADDLPGVEADLQNLKSAFGDRVDKILFGEQATESASLPLLARPGLLLFATHGRNEPDHPLDSHLALFPEGRSDGHLDARELFAGHTRSDLIVMSACYSGLADRSPLPGDDLFGVQRAFLQTGARTVVSGLWQVSDDTGPPLMKGFFERLAAGQTAPAALADSQRSFLKEQRSADLDLKLHPFFWAVYTAVGDHRTHFETGGPVR